MTEQVVLEINNLAKYYGKFLAVNNVNIDKTRFGDKKAITFVINKKEKLLVNVT
ncbi:MAG: hypothetical protein ACFFAU_13415 [Candidatus Hodarchaeota archaeon]